VAPNRSRQDPALLCLFRLSAKKPSPPGVIGEYPYPMPLQASPHPRSAHACPTRPTPGIAPLAATLLLLSLSIIPLSGEASDWPHFRGPNRNGISPEKGWKTRWSGDIPVAWKAQVGLGFSSIVVSNGRAATAGHAQGQDTVVCFEAASGKPLWSHSYPAELGDKFFEGGTTGTPTMEGDRLYWLSRWGDLFCFDAGSGKVLWQTQIAKETGAPLPTWGFTGAPLVAGDRLILNVGEAGTAVDKLTGKVLWKSAPKDAGYSTPLPLGELALFGSSKSYLAVNLKTGAEAWRVRWLTEYGVNAPDPVLAGQKLFLSTGYGKGGALLQLSSEPPAELWKTKKLRTQMNAAVLHNGHLYGVDGDTTQKASLKCLELESGEEKWSEPGFGSGGVIIADGHLLALSGNGELIIAPALPSGFQPTARTQVFGPKAWTAPVLANGLLYCRNNRGELVVLNLRSP
jgi:outer membrane protein assembly factor BamB